MKTVSNVWKNLWSFGNTAESAAINNLRMQIEPKARFKHVRNTSGPMFGKAALPQLLVDGDVFVNFCGKPLK